MNFEQLLRFAADQKASDVHLQAGATPQLRIGGLVRNVEGEAVDAEALRAFLSSIVPSSVSHLADALAEGLVFSRSIDGVGRFRCALFSTVGLPGVALRVVPAAVRSVEELNLPPVAREIALARGGLTLVTGIAGTGKSTTLSALVDAINANQHAKIITIENPVEYLHTRKKSLISQLELGLDTSSYEHGLSRALRQDPDVVVIDELGDQPTAILALRAAETGRQVIAAMVATSPIHAIERLLALVGPAEHSTAMNQLGGALEGILTQRLAQTKDGGRRPVLEILRGGPITAKALAERRISDLRNLPAGRQSGMQKLEQHLAELYQAGLISGTEAMRLALDPEAVSSYIRGGKTA